MQQGLYSKTLVDNEELAEAARQYAKVWGKCVDHMSDDQQSKRPSP